MRNSVILKTRCRTNQKAVSPRIWEDYRFYSLVKFFNGLRQQVFALTTSKDICERKLVPKKFRIRCADNKRIRTTTKKRIKKKGTFGINVKTSSHHKVFGEEV
ncbi:hypothetical protein BFX06_14225 [Sulfobacillus thermosulfidooxidans]|nr:hypothetical protein BFX05_07250 [Sulfobacillus thermosulfidooxidans]OLZ17087.1 hypothetical protein BFX06_14225 [Sulfobacillus thermosulfidooxidans]OLZ20183.1 hypothetical protein BFX07_00955 [Sulfobacillus thermosulfidooxidans]